MCQCRSLKQFCSRSFLLIVNTIDFTAGLILLTYSAYLANKHYAPASVYATIIVLGLLLLITATFGGMGITWPRQQCCCNVYYSSLLTVSSYLAIPCALLELISAIILFSSKDSIIEEGANSGVDPGVLEDITNPFIPIALLALCVLECFRFIFSKFLRGSVTEDVLKFRLMKEEEEAEQERVAQERQQKIGDKYSAYRQKFKNKYGMETPRAGKAAPSGSMEEAHSQF